MSAAATARCCRHPAGEPAPAGIVFDLPPAADARARTSPRAGLAERCEAVGGDFFKEVPGGGDAYLLKHVIHDWNDDRAPRFSGTAVARWAPTAKLLIVEGVYPPRIDQSLESRGAAANDVNMLVCTGGRQRSEAEFRALYDAAGFRLTEDRADAGPGQGDRGRTPDGLARAGHLRVQFGHLLVEGRAGPAVIGV